MVARLKLKGIDGRAPPGVNNHNCFAAVTLHLKAARRVRWSVLKDSSTEEYLQILLVCRKAGKTLKLRGTP